MQVHTACMVSLTGRHTGVLCWKYCWVGVSSSQLKPFFPLEARGRLRKFRLALKLTEFTKLLPKDVQTVRWQRRGNADWPSFRGAVCPGGPHAGKDFEGGSCFESLIVCKKLY